jgi:hypothetical protein
MNEGYASHKDYIGRVKEIADKRQQELEVQLKKAFDGFIELREVEVINFEAIDVMTLAIIIAAQPQVLKALLLVTNLAGRALKRDLKLNVDTYNPRIDSKTAHVLAGYIKPFLPQLLELPTLSHADRFAFIDKEVRKSKGAWEKQICSALITVSGIEFKKRKFTVGKETYELDAAFPVSGEVKYGVDVKRIEAEQDIHKRCDEIVNKATALKRVYPLSAFGAVVYYPFIAQQVNVRDRLESAYIDSVVFASESEKDITSAVKLLFAKLKEKISE